MASTRELLSTATQRLADAGVPSPEHDARALLMHVLAAPSRRALLPARLSTVEEERYATLIDQRADRVPLQHLTGMTGFRHLDLMVGPGVFIPRPETEVMVEWALRALRGADQTHPIVVDLCAGTAAIALSIAHEFATAEVHAVESDPMAHAWAQRNAEAQVHAGDAPIALHLADATDPDTLSALNGHVDLVLSNPPYIPVGSHVPPEVAEHDPPAALWGGEEGLTVLSGVLSRASTLLKPGGTIALEHGDSQGDAVPAVFRRAGIWERIVDHIDLNGRPRFTTACRGL